MGLLLTGAAAAVTAPQLLRAAPAFAQTAQAIPQTQNGRYVIVHSPWARADQFLIDTATGTVWQFAKYSYLNDDPNAWQLVPQLNTDAEVAAFERRHGYRPAPDAPATPPTSPVK